MSWIKLVQTLLASSGRFDPDVLAFAGGVTGQVHVRNMLHSNICLTRASAVHHEMGMLLSS